MAVKEKPKSDPTSRQERVLNDILANRGTMKAAMIKAGYSKAYSKNPKQFRQTSSWQDLLDDNLPDWFLLENHLELMGDPDSNVRLRALQEAYKVKAKYEPEVKEHVIRNYEDLSDEDLERLYHAKSKQRKTTTND